LNLAQDLAVLTALDLEFSVELIPSILEAFRLKIVGLEDFRSGSFWMNLSQLKHLDLATFAGLLSLRKLQENRYDA